jgi:hypothetical protein
MKTSKLWIILSVAVSLHEMKRHIIFLGFLIIVIGCKNSTPTKNIIYKLPDNKLINEIFYYVSKIDSFDLNYSISNDIVIPKLFKLGTKDPDSFKSFSCITYDELFLCFSSSDSLQKRKEDSIFIKYQIESEAKYNIEDSFNVHFNKKSNYYYKFNLPVFNFKKDNVEISYMVFSKDTLFRQKILEKHDSGWIEKKFAFGPNILM